MKDYDRRRKEVKFSNPYGITYSEVDVKEIEKVSGIPIDEAHRWTEPYVSPTDLQELMAWMNAFQRQDVPHVVVNWPNVGAVLYKHLYTGGYAGKPGFCCGASR